MTDWTIRRADVVDWADRYDGPRFHALLCDAPYHLGPDGFMGERWDASGVSFRPETWKALTRHLHPGAFLFVFAGAINDDLISVAMRRAGLRKHYKILTWVYAQGMPKGTRIDDQVQDNGWAYEARHHRASESLRDRLPPSLLAAVWEGHRYGLQSLKPALEPLLVFQKPHSGKPMDGITRTGAGALNIDAARITHDESVETANCQSPRFSGRVMNNGHRGGGRSSNLVGPSPEGRWPANFTASHHPLCLRVGTRRVKGTRGGNSGTRGNHVYGEFGESQMGVDPGYADEDGEETVADWRCHRDCAVLRLARQSGLTSTTGQRSERSRKAAVEGTRWGPRDHRSVEYGDEGTAARYFPQADWDVEVVEAALGAPGAYYTPKPSPKERDAGLCQRNSHPTVKPVALAEWLATLLLPPAQYGPRRLLVPFAGSGSEALGAMMAGWERVTLIEQSLDYCALTANRLAWWWPRVRQGMTEVKAVLDTWHKSDAEAQADQVDELPLFAGISNPSFQTA